MISASVMSRRAISPGRVQSILNRRCVLGLARSDNNWWPFGRLVSGAATIKSGRPVATVLSDAGASRDRILSDCVGCGRDGNSHGDRWASPIAELVRVGAATMMMAVMTGRWRLRLGCRRYISSGRSDMNVTAVVSCHIGSRCPCLTVRG